MFLHNEYFNNASRLNAALTSQVLLTQTSELYRHFERYITGASDFSRCQLPPADATTSTNGEGPTQATNTKHPPDSTPTAPVRRPPRRNNIAPPQQTARRQAFARITDSSYDTIPAPALAPALAPAPLRKPAPAARGTITGSVDRTTPKTKRPAR